MFVKLIVTAVLDWLYQKGAAAIRITIAKLKARGKNAAARQKLENAQTSGEIDDAAKNLRDST